VACLSGKAEAKGLVERLFMSMDFESWRDEKEREKRRDRFAYRAQYH